MKQTAFTLAEVLITLGIIGVVAAITMPTLINKYKERVTVTKVKKFYSVINQALLSAISKNGYVDEWGFSDNTTENSEHCSSEFVKFLLPELKILKDCQCNSGCIASSYKLLNGSTYSVNYDEKEWYYKIILADGSYLWIRDNRKSDCSNSDVITNNVCGLVWYDINGKQQPNKFGEDLFVFYIMKNRVIPYMSSDCKTSQGFSCSTYILQNGNMKYIY